MDPNTNQGTSSNTTPGASATPNQSVSSNAKQVIKAQRAEEWEQRRLMLVDLKIRSKLQKHIISQARCAFGHPEGTIFDAILKTQPSVNESGVQVDKWTAHVVAYKPGVSDIISVLERKDREIMTHPNPLDAMQHLLAELYDTPFG